MIFLPFMLALLSIPAFAQSVPMQTTQDRAEGNRLIIDGKPLFISGMNIAWNTGNSFGNDVGDTPLDVNAFTDHIKNIRKSGGNAVRWWLHTDAANCPKIDSDGKVTGIGSKTIQNIQQALDIAHEYGVVVSLTLFSFDLLVPGDGGKGDSYYPDYNLENNHKFLTTPTNIDTYIQNALTPILTAVGNHPAIMCWEVFNEAEGMLQKENWSHVQRKISMNDILRITNKIAGAVHRQTKKMASTGVKDFSYLSEYSDAKLKAAGGDNDGWLDFYMGHYYPEWQGTSISPFHNSASSWNADRPILIGEFPARSWPSQGSSIQQGTAMTIEAAYEYAYNNGYAGAMSWSMTEADVAKFGNYTTTAPALTQLFNSYKNDIMIKDVDIEELTGDLAMKLVLTNLPVLSSNWSELGTNKDISFSGRTNLVFEMFIMEGSGTNLDINIVVKTGSNWDWTPGQTLNLNSYEQGKWVTVTVPISSFGTGNLSQVKSILFQYGAIGNSYSGTIFFDNIKVDNTVISDFDDAKAWSLTADNSVVSIVPRNGTTPIIAKPTNAATIDLKTLDFSKAQIYDIHGKRVFANSAAQLKSGIYIVRINGMSFKIPVR